MLGKLTELIASQGSVLVALSGGVDSSVVAAVAHMALGNKACAVTGASPSLPSDELDGIRMFCASIGIEHQVVQTHELNRPGYKRNARDRCYHCKSELYDTLLGLAKKRGMQTVLDGTQVSDLSAHRPGHLAITERGILSPLIEVGATKAQVRQLATELCLPMANRPATPCLSSRIPYGLEVTKERLVRIEQAETTLRHLGFNDVRVRLHDAIARIEVPKCDLAAAVAQADVIQEALRHDGFTYVTLDLGGLRSGSLLEVVAQP